MQKIVLLLSLLFISQSYATDVSSIEDIQRECKKAHNRSYPGTQPISFKQCVTNLSILKAPNAIEEVGGGRSPAVLGKPIIANITTPPTVYPAENYGQRLVPGAPTPGIYDGSRDKRTINPHSDKIQKFARPNSSIPY